MVGLRPSLHDHNEDVLILQVKVFLWSFARFGYLGGRGTFKISILCLPEWFASGFDGAIPD